MNPTSEEPPWLSLAPTGWQRRLVFALVKLGIAHGDVKRVLERFWLSKGTETVADISRYGLNWRVDFSDNLTDKRLLLHSREQDGYEIRALSEMCGDGWFIDIGANIGYYSLRVAERGVRVLALEPHPVVYRRLLCNIRFNALEDKVVALPIGVGDEGEATLFFGENLGAGSTVNAGSDLQTCTIRLSPLGDILSAQGVRKVDAIKVDVEGAEDRVLLPFFQDAPEELWPRCVIMEDEHQGRWQTNVVEYLMDAGYRLRKKTLMNLILVRP